MKNKILYSFLISCLCIGVTSAEKKADGIVIGSSGFTTIQRDFSQLNVSKGASIRPSDQVLCNNGKTHIKIGKVDVWMSKGSKLIYTTDEKTQKIKFVEGNFYFKTGSDYKGGTSIETDDFKFPDLTDKTEVFVESSKNEKKVVSINQNIRIIQKDSSNRKYDTTQLKAAQQLQMSNDKVKLYIRNIEPIEKIYYSEVLLLEGEIKNTGPRNLVSLKPYLPEKAITDRSKKWFQKKNTQTAFKNEKLSTFKNILNVSSETSLENFNEAIQEDDAFYFPPPIDVPTSKQ